MTALHMIRGFDIWGNPCFHAVLIKPLLWAWTRPEHAGIILSDREHLITTLAGLVMEKDKGGPDGDHVTIWNMCQRLESSLAPRIFAMIDPAGNTWIDHKYMTPAEYLPLLVPEEEDKPDDDD